MNASVSSHLQMSFISLGTISSLSSRGIMAKPPVAYRESAKETRPTELRSWGKVEDSDHLRRKNTFHSGVIDTVGRNNKIFSIVASI